MKHNPEKTVVIKLGGHALDIPEIRSAFARDLLELSRGGMRFVIVHGGGPHISRMLEKLNIKSFFQDGLRVTSPETLEAVEMVLCGKINKEITRSLQNLGIKTAGISGEDGQTILAAPKDPRLGRVGEVSRVNPELIITLLENGYLPVVAPLGLAPDGQPLNINADTAAGAIAGALGASHFILISDVPGVLDGGGKLLRTLDAAQIRQLRQQEIISGGMIPKTEACLRALDHGCRQALILDGRQANSLARCLVNSEPLGTVIDAN